VELTKECRRNERVSTLTTRHTRYGKVLGVGLRTEKIRRTGDACGTNSRAQKGTRDNALTTKSGRKAKRIQTLRALAGEHARNIPLTTVWEVPV